MNRDIAISLLVQASNSYILLTANLEDLQSLAKQMLSSPFGSRLGKIWSRAYDQFNQALREGKRRPHRRYADDTDVSTSDDEYDSPKGFTKALEGRKTDADQRSNE